MESTSFFTNAVCAICGAAIIAAPFAHMHVCEHARQQLACQIGHVEQRDDHSERPDSRPAPRSLASNVGSGQIADFPTGRYVHTEPQQLRHIAQADVYSMPLVLMQQSAATAVNSGSQA